MDDMTAVTIRSARANDIEAIAEIQITAWQTNFCNEKLDQAINKAFSQALKKRWAQQFEQGYQVLIAEGEHEPLGFVGFCMHADGTQIAEINAFYLNDESLQPNIGPLLCNAALDEIKKNGYQEAAIKVLEENNQMKRFYESLGFHPMSTMKKSDETQTSKEIEYRISVN
jgi:ribosomal protein S18 acetylase RimI-like enzyme